MEYINLSTYRFAPLSNLKNLRQELLFSCRGWGLKGTILLSSEGINLFVAGLESSIEKFLTRLRKVPGLEGLEAKRSVSGYQPFTRMLVRIKQEIIPFGVEGINPALRTSPKLPAKELKQWLDEGRPITLLDTRNDYEVKLGSFTGATTLDIHHFRDFPKAVKGLPENLKEQPVVMFCTGGIRCEKAGPYMESQGFQQVFQLDGGILKYFEEVGSEHYQGDCFVFDRRVGVDPSLQESSFALCYACLAPVSVEEQKDSRYVQGVSCPYCFRASEVRMKEQIVEREEKLRRLTSPLPGSEPYQNYRPFRIPATFDGKTLLESLSMVLKHVSSEVWASEIEKGNLLNRHQVAVGMQQIVRAGERYFHQLPMESEPDVSNEIRICYEDAAVIVVEKPSPLPVHPSGRFNRNTLQHFLNLAYAPERPRIAHRLDANTTGILLVARTHHVAGILQPQFMKGEIEKKYHARVYGHPSEEEFICELPIGGEPKVVGSRAVDEGGLAAKTEFKVLKRDRDGTTLLEVKPITGRTNQIRIHLWKLGYPIVGDPLYLPGFQLGDRQTHDIDDDKMKLHAKSIAFTHPLTHQRMQFDSHREL